MLFTSIRPKKNNVDNELLILKQERHGIYFYWLLSYIDAELDDERQKAINQRDASIKTPLLRASECVDRALYSDGERRAGSGKAETLHTRRTRAVILLTLWHLQRGSRAISANGSSLWWLAQMANINYTLDGKDGGRMRLLKDSFCWCLKVRRRRRTVLV